LLYATTPIQRIIGIAEVRDVVAASPTALWKLAQQYGGGVSRKELYDYFDGKNEGFGIVLKNVLPFSKPLDPKKLISNFSAPQSFRYIEDRDFRRVLRQIENNNGLI
jgi:predicted transcriptional regulator